MHQPHNSVNQLLFTGNENYFDTNNIQTENT